MPTKPLTKIQPPILDETLKEAGITGNGNGATIITTSSALAEWEIEAFRELAEEKEAEKEVETPKPEEKEPGDDFESLLTAMTSEQADAILEEITEYEGRLPITIKTRNGQEVTYYVRMPTEKENKLSERKYIAELHQLRALGVMTTAELVHQIMRSMEADEKEKIDAIQNDPEIPATRKNSELLMFFLGTPYMGLIQQSADVIAQREANSMLASGCVEKLIEIQDGKEMTQKFVPVWKTAEAFDQEDMDVTTSVVIEMNLVHRKLSNARFLASSSGGADAGDSRSN